LLKPAAEEEFACVASNSTMSGPGKRFEEKWAFWLYLWLDALRDKALKSFSGTRELLREFPKKTAFQLRRLTAEAEQSDAAAELA
jgi:hypothetical protein